MCMQSLKSVTTFYIRGQGGDRLIFLTVHGSRVWEAKVHQSSIQIPTPGAAAVQPRILKPLESCLLACQMGLIKPIARKAYGLAHTQSCWDSVSPKINQRCPSSD